MAKSVEELVEDWAKKSLDKSGVMHYAKNAEINPEIGAALKSAVSKSGGKGGNLPDIQVFIETKHGRKIPVFIEVKGKIGDLGRRDEAGVLIVDNRTAKGDIDFKRVNKFAINGAIHYAETVVRGTKSYKESIAIGVNGWQNAEGALKTELAVYYVSQDKLCVPKKIADYSDLSFLKKSNLDDLIEKLDELELTEAEKEEKTREIENAIEIKLKELNQQMQDKLAISVDMRVSLVSGMIMAGLGVEDKVSPLDVADLKGDKGEKSHDGVIIHNKIASFLEARDLPSGKKEMILNVLAVPLLHGNLHNPKRGESPLKTVYTFLCKELMPYFTSKYHLDFTGRLFNVLNAWVKVPDGDQNDVVLTPRYVTNFMARLCGVNRKSYVWDYAVGSAGFLVSAMKLMLEDAKANCKSPDEYRKAESQIKMNQLLGIEKLPDVYMLAVLNMILMGDGSANIIHANSLTEYDGNYGQGKNKGQPFPADVFLLNPPYSAPGKGFVFVEKALSRMKHGRAAVLIQENAGSGEGDEYTSQILKHSSLIASIHMADIFKGKASVRTAVYVFEVGKPHNVKQMVKFIDFDNDGYTRQNRKKSGLDVNLRDTDDATGRYDEVVNLVLYGKKYLKIFLEDNFIEDTISLEGNDWTFAQHKKVDTTAKVEDFQKVVKEYLSWKVDEIIKQEDALGKNASPRLNLPQARAYADFKIGELFELKKGKRLTKASMLPGDIRFIGASATNNGITGFVGNDKYIHPSNTITVSYNGSVGEAFYQSERYWASDDINVFYAKFELTETRALYIIPLIRQQGKKYTYSNKWTKEKMENDRVRLPVLSKESRELDFAYMDAYIRELETARIRELEAARLRELEKYIFVTGLDNIELSKKEKLAMAQLKKLKPEVVSAILDGCEKLVVMGGNEWKQKVFHFCLDNGNS